MVGANPEWDGDLHLDRISPLPVLSLVPATTQVSGGRTSGHFATVAWVSREVGERELAVVQRKSPQNDLSRGNSAGLQNLTFLARVNDAQLLHQLRGRPS